MLRGLYLSFVLILSAFLMGCGGDPTTSGSTQVSDEQEIKNNLAKLSEADRKMAQEQKICPVTEEPLGSMGVPKKVKVGDKEVFICCATCETALTKEPEKHLKKIGKEKE